MFNLLYTHEWLDCDKMQNDIAYFEGIFHWSHFIQHMIDLWFTFIGFKRDCSTLAKSNKTESSAAERVSQDIDPDAFVSFSQNMGQGNTFTMDDWSYIKYDEDTDDNCILYISGLFQRQVKIDHIEINRYDNESGDLLYSESIKGVENGVKTGLVGKDWDFTWNGPCDDIYDDDSTTNIDAMVSNSWLPWKSSTASVWQLETSYL